MCGIIGYIGRGDRSTGELIDALARLEYRGYDSAGIVAVKKKNAKKNSSLLIKRAVGKIAMLEGGLDRDEVLTRAILHTRWATHGKPSAKNAHPHADCVGNIFVVHNGIIENYRELREMLEKNGHSFKSETDTEVISHLVEEMQKKFGNFADAVEGALTKLVGAYAILVLSKKDEMIIAARLSSPLLIGLGDKEYFFASDPVALLAFTHDFIELDDGERAVVTESSHRIFRGGKELGKKTNTLDWSAEAAEKGGYRHFMEKEIYESPAAVENAIRGRLLPKIGAVKLGGLESATDDLRKLSRIMITACGTAYYAGLTGKYLLEEYGGIQADVELASELRYRSPVLGAGAAVLAVSQSGETADTLAAIKEAKRRGLMTLGIVNKVGTAIPRETDAGVYNHAGPEIAVASTKAFLSQLAVFEMMAVYFGRERGLSLSRGKEIVTEIEKIPNKLREILKQVKEIDKISKKYVNFTDMYFLGRKYSYPVALEGSLKMKEIAYIHAEAYAAGEMKHGAMTLVKKDFACIFIVPQDSVYEKTISNIEEVKARGGRILAIATEGDKKIGKLANDVIYVPKTLEPLTPLLSTLPLYLFAYEIARLKGRDIDKPRNIAKTVTVE